MDIKGTQPYTYMCPFPHKLPSHSGYQILSGRVPYVADPPYT